MILSGHDGLEIAAAQLTLNPIIFFGSPVIASASASRCCGSSASPALRDVHGTLF
jgi:hypothetical protein